MQDLPPTNAMQSGHLGLPLPLLITLSRDGLCAPNAEEFWAAPDGSPTGLPAPAGDRPRAARSGNRSPPPRPPPSPHPSAARGGARSRTHRPPDTAARSLPPATDKGSPHAP